MYTDCPPPFGTGEQPSQSDQAFTMAPDNSSSSGPLDSHKDQDEPLHTDSLPAPVGSDPRPPHQGPSPPFQEHTESMGYNPWADTLEMRSGHAQMQADPMAPSLTRNQTAETPASALPAAAPPQGTSTANSSTAGNSTPHWQSQPPQPIHSGDRPAYDSHYRSPSGSSYPGCNVAPQFQSNNPFLKAVQQHQNDTGGDGSPASAIAPSAPALTSQYGLENVAPPPRPQSASSPLDDTTRLHSMPLNKSYTGPNPPYASQAFQSQSEKVSLPIVPPKQSMPDEDSRQQTDTTGNAVPSVTVDSTDEKDLPPLPRRSGADGGPSSNPAGSQNLIDLSDDDRPATTQSDGSSWQHFGSSDGTPSVAGSAGPDTPLEADSDGRQETSQPSGLTPPESSQPESSRPTPMSESQIRQREAILAETYDIRTVNWTDGTTELRKSPVLVQNQNGPCPLLALVNGLVLRTPPGTQSPLVRTLNSKEKISVSLLIYAIFDELTTYVDEESQLPDIEALSSFLTVLHTGMNVNPRLTPTPDTPGTFLETRDTNLYRTFNLPLVHGWLAPPHSDAHSALVRVAEYHEDIQLLHFRKEELEDKASRGDSLSADDLQLIQDIECIQHFVNDENATQLSRYGLDHLNRTIAPGSISILFRNDHFSTLFKHPSSHQLFTLVTDMGFSRHAEIVWESFVDINGSESELYSGDFRPVGHGPTSSLGHQNSQQNESGAGPSRTNNSATRTDDSQAPSSEQTDADYAFALALQFQDEEEQRARGNQRNESNRGRSHTHTQSTGVMNRARPTGRRSTGQSHQNVQTLIPHREPNAPGDDPNAPPPTYEQAAKSPVFNPPADHPQYAGPAPTPQRPNAPSGRVAGPRTSSQGFSNASSPGGRRMPGPDQRPRPNWPMDPLQPGPVQSLPDRPPRERDRKDCIVM